MFCRNCGKNIVDGGNVCPNCGTYVQRGTPAPTTAPKATLKATPTATPTAEPKKEKQSNGMAVTGFVCSFLSPLLGWIFGGIGLKRAEERGGAGKGLSTAALIIATANFAFNLYSFYSMLF